MSKLFLPIILICLSACTAPGSETTPDQSSGTLLKAFPGAEGFGRYATGGREGTVYHVTNLNNSGEGSFREAVSSPNRIVVFDTCGIIRISGRVYVASDITIAGQTAPGEGIVIYGDGVSFSGANNVIVRCLRIRMGINGKENTDAMGIAYGKNMIFDHVSVSWGRDENFSISWDTSKSPEPTNITIQNSIISHGLMPHAMGGLIQSNGGITLYRNLYANNKSRNPKVKGLNQFVNNVVYNWSSSDGYILGGSQYPSWAMIEDNYFIRGPRSGGGPFNRANENFQVYHRGNYIDSNKNGALDGTSAADTDYGNARFVTNPTQFCNIPSPHPRIESQLSAQEAYAWIIKKAGACYPARDEVDRLVINDLLSLGTQGLLITNESDLGLQNNVGILQKGIRPTDSDNDGIPDQWELDNGLDPMDSSDAFRKNNEGYIYLEIYLNSLVKD